MAGDVYRPFCAAAVQAAPDREFTIAKLEEWVARAKAAGADLVVFGESYIPAFHSGISCMPRLISIPFIGAYLRMPSKCLASR
jgi:hypothetical protein